MRLLHENAIFQTVKSKVIISLFETVRLSVSISLRNLYNSLNSIKEMMILGDLNSEQNGFSGAWLVGCFGFNGPLRQYFSLYRVVS